MLRRLAGGGAGVLAVLRQVNLVAVECDRLSTLNAGQVLAAGQPLGAVEGGNLSAWYDGPFEVKTLPSRDIRFALPLIVGVFSPNPRRRDTLAIIWASLGRSAPAKKGGHSSNTGRSACGSARQRTTPSRF